MTDKEMTQLVEYIDELGRNLGKKIEELNQQLSLLQGSLYYAGSPFGYPSALGKPKGGQELPGAIGHELNDDHHHKR